MKFAMFSLSISAAVLIFWAKEGRAQQVFPPSTGGMTGYQIVANSVKVAEQRTSQIIATCPAGKKVLGGGAKFSPENQSGDSPAVYTYPGKSDSAWVAELRRRDGGIAGSL
jgi:hypothetical protein